MVFMSKTAVVQDKQRKRTRENLIDAARRLFARRGMENTTINEIAEESRHGRRTVYMYFQNKSEIFLAVVGKELELLSRLIQNVAESDAPIPKRLARLIVTHQQTIFDIVMRNGSLKASFFKDIERLERIRLRFDISERNSIQYLLEQGCKEGLFTVSDSQMAAEVIQAAIKGYEVSYIQNRTRNRHLNMSRLHRVSMELIFKGIGYTGNIIPYLLTDENVTTQDLTSNNTNQQ